MSENTRRGIQTICTVLAVLLILVATVYASIRDVESRGGDSAPYAETTQVPVTQDPDSSIPMGTPDFHGIPYEPYENNGFNQATYEARLTANPTYTLGNFDD